MDEGQRGPEPVVIPHGGLPWIGSYTGEHPMKVERYGALHLQLAVWCRLLLDGCEVALRYNENPSVSPPGCTGFLQTSCYKRSSKAAEPPHPSGR